MMQAFHAAALGLENQQKNIDIIANNIANINTTGYKKNRATFKDALYVALTNPENPNSGANLMQGTGVILNSISKIFTGSNYTETGSVLDVAIFNEEGFFVIEGADGELKYTRDGNFKVSVEDEIPYLVTKSGDYVLGQDYERIQIEGDISKLQIDENGNLYNDLHENFATLNIVSFNNLDGLQPLGDNSFALTDQSGEPIGLENPNIKHKYIEMSNVDLAEEMVNLIKAQRAYQLSSKALTVADDMEGIANNLRR